MPEELIVGHVALPQGFEFHLARADSPTAALCGATVSPTQIPPMFYGVESAIEGRWCARCEALAREHAARAPEEVATPGDAPCV